jgi:hypothetical protein
VITAVEQTSWDAQRGEVKLTICVDSSGTTVHDATGADVAPTDRAETYALSVRFEVLSHDMAIASTQQDVTATC